MGAAGVVRVALGPEADTQAVSGGEGDVGSRGPCPQLCRQAEVVRTERALPWSLGEAV